MAKPKRNIEATIEELVMVILEDALKAETPLAIRLEAMKVLNPFFSTTVKAKRPDAEPEGDSFTSFKSNISVANQKAPQ